VLVEPADPFTEAIRRGLKWALKMYSRSRRLARGLISRIRTRTRMPCGGLVCRRYVRGVRVYPQPRTEEMERHAAGIAWKLQGTDRGARVRRGLAQSLDPLLDAMEEPRAHRGASADPGIEFAEPAPDSLAEITVDYPALQGRYENFRAQMTDPKQIDRPARATGRAARAEKAYEASTAERMAHWQRRLLARYTRNLALAGKRTDRGLYDLAVAAPASPTITTRGKYGRRREVSAQRRIGFADRAHFGRRDVAHTRRIRLRRRLPSPKRRLGRSG